MKNPRFVLWPLAFFPWIDLLARLGADPLHLDPLLAGAWDELFLVFCLLFVSFRVRQGLPLPSLPAAVRWSLLAFLSACVLSLLVNRVPLAVGSDAFRVTFEPMLFAVVTMTLLRDRELLDEFVQLTIFSGVLIALVGLAQYALEIESWRWQNKPYARQFRVVSIFANPNALAGYLNMILALSLARFSFSGIGRRMLTDGIASLTLLGALLVTFSRAAWIACIAMSLSYARITRKWVPALPAAILIGFLFVPSDVATRFAELVGATYYRQSADAGRLAFWPKALAEVRRNPLLGTGMGMFGDSVAIRHQVSEATWVDNHYLKIAAELGLTGLLSFVALLSALFVRTWKAHRRAPSDRERAMSLGILGVILVMVIQNATASVWEALYVGVQFDALVGILFALPETAADASGRSR